MPSRNKNVAPGRYNCGKCKVTSPPPVNNVRRSFTKKRQAVVKEFIRRYPTGLSGLKGPRSEVLAAGLYHFMVNSENDTDVKLSDVKRWIKEHSWIAEGLQTPRRSSRLESVATPPHSPVPVLNPTRMITRNSLRRLGTQNDRRPNDPIQQQRVPTPTHHSPLNVDPPNVPNQNELPQQQAVDAPNGPIENEQDIMEVPNAPIGNEQDFVDVPLDPFGNEQDIMAVQLDPFVNDEDVEYVPNDPIGNQQAVVDVPNDPIGNQQDVVDVPNDPIGNEQDVVDVPNDPIGNQQNIVDAPNGPIDNDEDVIYVPHDPYGNDEDDVYVPPIGNELDVVHVPNEREQEAGPVSHRCPLLVNPRVLANSSPVSRFYNLVYPCFPSGSHAFQRTCYGTAQPGNCHSCSGRNTTRYQKQKILDEYSATLDNLKRMDAFFCAHPPLRHALIHLHKLGRVLYRCQSTFVSAERRSELFTEYVKQKGVNNYQFVKPETNQPAASSSTSANNSVALAIPATRSTATATATADEQSAANHSMNEDSNRPSTPHAEDSNRPSTPHAEDSNRPSTPHAEDSNRPSTPHAAQQPQPPTQ